MTTRSRIPLLLIMAITLSSLVAGCSAVKLPGVFRLDIQQGNVITQEMLGQLELGMDRRKVRFILGTPLISDPFNQDRWDYLYSLEKGGGERIQRHVSLLFENDRLVSIEGDVRGGPTPEGVRPREDTVVTVPAERRGEGFLSALIPGFMKKDSGKPRDSATTSDDTGSAAVTATAGGSESGAPAAEGEPQTISDEDRAELEELFGDYGRLSSSAPESAPVSRPATTRDLGSR